MSDQNCYQCGAPRSAHDDPGPAAGKWPGRLNCPRGGAPDALDAMEPDDLRATAHDMREALLGVRMMLRLSPFKECAGEPWAQAVQAALAKAGRP